MTAVGQQCPLWRQSAYTPARNVQPSGWWLFSLLFNCNPHFVCVWVHELKNGREARFYCNVQGGWFKSLCRKLTHLLLRKKIFNTNVIPSFSSKVRQCVQNLPAWYFLNSENVLRKFSCKNLWLQQNRFAPPCRVSQIPVARQQAGKGGEGGRLFWACLIMH